MKCDADDTEVKGTEESRAKTVPECPQTEPEPEKEQR